MKDPEPALFFSFLYLQGITTSFPVSWEDQTISVSASPAPDHYILQFEDGTEKHIAYSSGAWRYAVPPGTSAAELEDTALSEESAVELGLELEAAAIGILIDQKKAEQQQE